MCIYMYVSICVCIYMFISITNNSWGSFSSNTQPLVLFYIHFAGRSGFRILMCNIVFGDGSDQ